MKMNEIVLGLVMAGWAFGVALPANAQQSSFEVDTVAEFNFLELEEPDLANVPENRRTSYFAPVHEGDFAVRKCTESQNQQTQHLSARTVITGWTPVVQFTTKSFKRPCQMLSCSGIGFVDADNQTLKVRAFGENTVEVLLDCKRSRKTN